MANEDIALMAHLMRRAGFGVGRSELEVLAAKGYEATVEDLVNPQEEPADKYEFFRYHPGYIRHITSPGMGAANWLHTNDKHPARLGREDGPLLAPRVRPLGHQKSTIGTR